MKRLFLGLFALSLVSCATTYQPLDAAGGYVDYQTGQDLYYLYYAGNEYSSPEQIYQLFLARAARIALENHYGYFYVQSVHDATVRETRSIPGHVYTREDVDVYRDYARSRYGDVGYLRTRSESHTIIAMEPPRDIIVSRPGFRGEILLVHEALPGQPAPFDAAMVSKDGEALNARLEAGNRAVEWSVIGVTVAAVILGLAFQ